MTDDDEPRDAYVVRGGNKLTGTVRVPGAKNSALKLFAAALLTDQPVTLEDLPGIADIPVMAELLRSVGADVTDLGDGRGRIVAGDGLAHAPDPDAVRAIRASTSLLGPLLGRLRRVELALPGGDDIGARGIDLHLAALAALGARVTRVEHAVRLEADRLQGARITLDYPSVGATENLVMAAVLADGTTVLDNAAREPEIQDLCRMLVAMGAAIDGIGTATLTVHGVERLHGVTWTVVPDRIEVGTWVVAAAITDGDVVIDNVRTEDLALPLRKFAAVGVDVDDLGGRLRVRGGNLRATNVVTLPYPGLPTDLQPQFMVLLSQAEGSSRCTENVFESRFAFVDELRRMGARITVDGHHAMIEGPSPLHGATLRGLDVRAGAAGVLAGLVATGETIVTDIHHVKRGYTRFAGRLQDLGASVEER